MGPNLRLREPFVETKRHVSLQAPRALPFRLGQGLKLSKRGWNMHAVDGEDGLADVPAFDDAVQGHDTCLRDVRRGEHSVRMRCMTFLAAIRSQAVLGGRVRVR